MFNVPLEVARKLHRNEAYYKQNKIKGMYNDVYIEDTYYKGRSRKRISFRSDGIEVMYGISDWSGSNSKLELLVIDDGVNITEVKYQK